MSFPNIPDVSPIIAISREGVVSLLLASIAFEELGLSHIINSEAEKIQYVLGTLEGQRLPVRPTIADLLKINQSVEGTLKDVIKTEILLDFKLEDIIRIINVSAIEVLKEVSPDNGVTWFDANTPPGPDVPIGINPQFRFTVTNTSNTPLTNVTVTDDVLGPNPIIGPIANFPAGASAQTIVIGVWAAGQQINTATANGTDPFGGIVTDTNPANWFGAEPAIDVLKEVSPDNGVTWFDANTPPGPDVPLGINPQFRFTVTNTGNVALTNVTVTDDVLPGTIIGPIASLAPGASQQTIVIGVWAKGSQINTATATGTYDSQALTVTDPANWFGAVPAIDVLKEVSPNNGVTWFNANTPPGPNVPIGTNPQFRFTVTNIGNVTLTNVTVTDNVLPGTIIGPIASFAPGASQQAIVIGVWAAGQQINTATATGTYDGQTLSATDPANWFGVNP